MGQAEYNGVNFYAIDEKDYTVVVFRGTQSIQNAKTDFNIKETNFLNINNAKVHSGFYNIALKSKEVLRSILKKDKKIYITGHSLGGAISILLGSILHKQGYKIEVISFGAPPVGNQKFVNLISNLKHFRYIHKNDIIPKLNQKTAIKLKARIELIQETLSLLKTGKKIISFKSAFEKPISNYISAYMGDKVKGLINPLSKEFKNLKNTILNIKYNYVHDNNNVILLDNKVLNTKTNKSQSTSSFINKFVSRSLQYHDINTYIADF